MKERRQCERLYRTEAGTYWRCWNLFEIRGNKRYCSGTCRGSASRQYRKAEREGRRQALIPQNAWEIAESEYEPDEAT